MSEVTNEALAASDCELDDIDLFVYHQANSRIIRAVGQRLGTPVDRVVDYVDRFANASTATLPLALSVAEAEGGSRRDDRVLLAAFGGGLTWGATVLQWSSDRPISLTRSAERDPDRVVGDMLGARIRDLLDYSQRMAVLGERTIVDLAEVGSRPSSASVLTCASVMWPRPGTRHGIAEYPTCRPRSSTRTAAALGGDQVAVLGAELPSRFFPRVAPRRRSRSRGPVLQVRGRVRRCSGHLPGINGHRLRPGRRRTPTTW